MKNKTKLKILFTFDYELFLGSKSGSVVNCLIKPTELILDSFNKYNIKNAIFFVDTIYLIQLKKQLNDSCKSDYNLIVNQLIKVLNNNHYIFPHIHPHWLDAKYISEINQWDLSDYSKYRFTNLDFETREMIFEESINIINEIISKSKNNYKVNSYRAGGWSIQPFDDFINIFKKYGIINDFTVLPGFANTSDAQYFDFKNCPENKHYYFSNDPCIEDKSGIFKEYSISSIELSYLNKILSKINNKITFKLGYRNYGDGESVSVNTNSSRIKKNHSNNKEMLSFELLNLSKLNTYKRFIKKNNYIHFISHPKMLSLHNFYCMDRLLNWINKNHSVTTNFNNF